MEMIGRACRPHLGYYYAVRPFLSQKKVTLVLRYWTYTTRRDGIQLTYYCTVQYVAAVLLLVR
jgi:hypothetical protein